MEAGSNLDDFNYWIADMDDALDQFLDSLSGGLRSKLDYSPESLDALEAWILSRYPTTKTVRTSGESVILDGLARYVGETFRRNAGGQWDIELDDPKSAYFGVPFLKGFRIPICPMALVTTATDRRTGKFIRTVLEKNLNRPKADIGRR